MTTVLAPLCCRSPLLRKARAASQPRNIWRITPRSTTNGSIEVVSPESAARDHGEKLIEYEAAGVQEYWGIGPLRADARFYHLRLPQKVYNPVWPDSEAVYRTPLLPHLALHVPTLWQDTLPGIIATVNAVQTMLTGVGGA